MEEKKKKKKTKYKGVRQGRRQSINSKSWFATKITDGEKWTSQYFHTEAEAAMAYDLHLIHLGLDPVNRLKPKKKNSYGTNI